MSNRGYLNITTEAGKFYVSNFSNVRESMGSVTIGIGSTAGKSAMNCIVAGPFDTEEAANEWTSRHPEQVGAFAWG